jgi:hypothetical protein
LYELRTLLTNPANVRVMTRETFVPPYRVLGTEVTNYGETF